MRVCAGLMVSVACYLHPSPCQAEAPQYALEYAADPTCPGRAQFEGLISYYLESELPAPGARVQVGLSEGDAGARGSLTLERADGTRYTRELGAATCQEVAPAVAFVLAYALAGREAEQAAPSTAPITEPTTVQPSAATSSLSTTEVTDRGPPSNRRAGSSWRFGVGVALGARTGLGPIWTTVEAARVEARRERDEDPLVLAFVASLLRDETITRIDRNGTTTFAWLAGRLDFCPVRLELQAWLSLLPCGGAHLGRLLATGEPLRGSGARGREVSKLWADAVLATRLELRLWRVLALEAQGELVVPLTTYRFAFDNPDTPVYQVPHVAAAGFVGLAVHFL